MKRTSAAEVVIVVNSGGWGNIPIERCPEVLPIVKGIADYLDSCGWRVVVVPFSRAPVDSPATTPSPITQLITVAEMFSIHHSRARALVREIESLVQRNPDLRFVLLGISNGAVFVDQATGLLSPLADSRVVAIEIGPPSWHGRYKAENILQLDNEGQDPLTQGKFEEVFASLLGGFMKFAFNLFTGNPTRFEEIWHIPGHDYPWEAIRHKVCLFLSQSFN